MPIIADLDSAGRRLNQRERLGAGKAVVSALTLVCLPSSDNDQARSRQRLVQDLSLAG